MAVSASQSPARGKSRKGSGRSGPRRRAEKGAGEYAREAVAEWRKAAKLGMAALSPAARKDATPRGKSGRAASKPSLVDRLGGGARDGGRLGPAADALLSRLGGPGRAASKLGLGSRLVERLRPDALGGNGNGHIADLSVPIQEAIEIAVPVRAVYALATRFEGYTEFSDRVEGAEEVDEGRIAIELRLRGHTRRIELELTHEQPEQRIEWESTEGPRNSGTISFHELAPRLTHVELSVDLEPDDLIQRVTRAAHLTERSIRAELRRFKAYAELWQDEEEIDQAPADDAEVDSGEDEAGGPQDDDVDDQDLEEDPQAYEDDAEAFEDDDYDDDLEDDDPEAYEDDEIDDEPTDEAYVDETAEADHHEAYEEVSR